MSGFAFRAPGKLFVAGEYGVVHPGNPAVLIAVDRAIAARALPVRRARGVRVESELWGEERDYEPAHVGDAVVEPREPVFLALGVLEEYLGSLPSLDIHLSSTLEETDGRKYGFGSSGAVVVATIGAVLRALDERVSPLDLFKLSALAVLEGNVRASCADVATSVLGGWVLYRSFDREAVRELRVHQGVRAAIAADWPGLALEILDVPGEIEVVIGWSGAPASTRSLVSQVDESAREGRVDLDAFKRDNAAHVERLASELRAGDANAAMATLIAVLAQLRGLDRAAGGEEALGIETPDLRLMAEIAARCGAAAKFSGAGGGDCVIALAPNAQVAHSVREAWHSSGLMALDVSVEPSDPDHRQRDTKEERGGAHE